MAYQSLYRRYRPQRFGEVRGQDHVVTRAAQRRARGPGRPRLPVQRAPRHGQDLDRPHPRQGAQLRRTPVDGEPCGVCESCLAVEAGTCFDVHELDAASNNGVDAIRDLIDKAALGTPGRTKVYILDEVHMLSTAASNALLKTLEEPPDARGVRARHHRSAEGVRHDRVERAQQLDFHLLPTEELAEYVRFVIERRRARRQRRHDRGGVASGRRLRSRRAVRFGASRRGGRIRIRRRCTRRRGRGAHRSRRRPGHRRGRSCDGERSRRTVARRAPRCPTTRCVPVVDGSRCAPASAHGRRPSG